MIKKILKNIKSTSEKTKLAGWKNMTKKKSLSFRFSLKEASQRRRKKIEFFSGDVNSKLRTRLNVL